MNIVFDFLKYNTLYERCVMASVAHAIMVGKYNLLLGRSRPHFLQLRVPE